MTDESSLGALRVLSLQRFDLLRAEAAAKSTETRPASRETDARVTAL